MVALLLAHPITSSLNMEKEEKACLVPDCAGNQINSTPSSVPHYREAPVGVEAHRYHHREEARGS